ncbi:hypothetical protein Adeg_0699 [Ammonifex degensii KC4]|uniref:Transposase n=1 Tax=Ammonifex degensii (strain DSM 10501 / KC4) TaxID=429009 RepID=C9RC69_AMMDK|nr:hypothetical protein [Ammonifex degensii]ACX51846.1 hypothetical protein Adeg_0699 [Ammonifex degensii KC4]
MATVVDNRGRLVRVPSDRNLKRKIEKYARFQVKLRGVIPIGQYYHPREFRPYKEYYQYRLWLEQQRVQQVREEVWAAKVEALVQKYVRARDSLERYQILLAAWSCGGKQAVEALANMVGACRKRAYKALLSYMRYRNYKRRLRDRVAVLVPPPAPNSARAIRVHEAGEVALESAGGGEVWGQGRSGQTWDAKQRGSK